LTIAPFVGSTGCGSWPAPDAAKIQHVVMVLGDIALQNNPPRVRLQDDTSN
jgi:hypothetical protein